VAGCFTQDAVGDWYLCLPVHQEVMATPAKYKEAGIDLGLETLAAASDSWKVHPPRFYREGQEKLAELQRPFGTDKKRKKTRRSKKLTRLHRKVARQRKDFTNKATSKVVKRYQNIGIGDVSVAFLGSGTRAKSARDAAVGAFKAQVLNKASRPAGVSLSSTKSSQRKPAATAGRFPAPRARAGLL
jgi:putative transposase